MSLLAEVAFGLIGGVLAVALALLAIRLIVGDPNLFRDMWQCRERPIREWRDRRRSPYRDVEGE